MKDRKALGKGSEVAVGWCKNRPAAYTFSVNAYSTSSVFVFRPFNN